MGDQGVMAERAKAMSDSQLLDAAARFNAELRRGRRMEAEGRELINANINEYVACQNEFYSRVSDNIQQKTDHLEREGA
jgi:hypothetical protein